MILFTDQQQHFLIIRIFTIIKSERLFEHLYMLLFLNLEN